MTSYPDFPSPADDGTTPALSHWLWHCRRSARLGGLVAWPRRSRHPRAEYWREHKRARKANATNPHSADKETK